MLNWRIYNSSDAKMRRSDRARKAAQARWVKYHDHDAPQRESRTVEITICDSHRPMTRITLRREQDDERRWGRWRILGIDARPLGPTGVGKLLAHYLD